MTEEIKSKDVIDVVPELRTERSRKKTKSVPLPPLPRLHLKTGEILQLPEGYDLVHSDSRRLLKLLDRVSLHDSIYYDDVELMELADRLPFEFEEREERVAHQIIVPRAGRVMTNERVLADFPFTWGDVTRGGRWIPRDGDLTRNAIAMVRRLGEVLKKLGNLEARVLVWYAPKGLRIFEDDSARIYAQYHTGHGVQFSVEGMQAEEVQEAFDPLWDGGMGCGKDFTYLDMRGYRARWRFLKT